ncbi:hypothetical protein LEP1GSC036_0728 [Leptospira weilii str. 2006001853]|uniref:Uncharacterized protein n=4 Tax=Leptospira weilii TaxID=28184 RepID=A0A828Z7X4_9LEPT|nr:hypothetical protein LEP1GSC036_0728 [Leptospira weilii str. 2006001853]EMJ65662.1 hypothetical protein LEP1GSC051_1199 [Leptospira sp. P2653]EMM74982.1 hypothetical protein LEP1GSC038_0877 [Leptospira weilii str. 2006001855]EMN46662.1 hypothetical protein LEP1GSC086_4112 [Leptospira weilii str. LNT 1234]EMN90878.1 hypothetical protein LEP1GSC108_2292 [Leptospira weilii str. UI 13098]EMY12234.1 hypothetical protein LEP1GSC043_3657 [Leptospira weilii str. Ecochallenge]
MISNLRFKSKKNLESLTGSIGAFLVSVVFEIFYTIDFV